MKEEFGPLAPYCPHQRPKKGKRKYTASDLWAKWVEYASWVNEHPVQIPKQQLFKGEVRHLKIVKFRPYIRSEFLRFAKINPKTWNNWKAVYELGEIVQDIEDIIHEQRLIGGYINHFNTTITSQDLGLKTVVEQINKDDGYEAYLDRIAESRKAQEAYEKRRGIKGDK